MVQIMYRPDALARPVFGEIELDPFHTLFRVEVTGPLPGRNGEMDLVVLRRDAERLGAAPGDRADIGVFLAVLFKNQALRRIDLGDAIGDLEVHDPGGIFQPLRMLGAMKDLAAVGALAFENAAGVMQAVGEHADLAVRRRNELSVEPDQIGTFVKRHC
jgi:hypothetical protein